MTSVGAETGQEALRSGPRGRPSSVAYSWWAWGTWLTLSPGWLAWGPPAPLPPRGVERTRQKGAAPWPARGRGGGGAGGGGGARPYHAGRDAAGPGADHHVRDLAAPELLAVGVGQEGQGRLLQLVGGLVGWRDTGGGGWGAEVRSPHPAGPPRGGGDPASPLPAPSPSPSP